VGTEKKTEPILDVDAFALMVDRVEGKLAPEDAAYLQALKQRLLAVRDELRSSDASMDRVRQIMRGVTFRR
jgi:hypothetical protein